jgi:hypothetical protein
VDDLAQVPLAFPTYTGNLAYVAAAAARQLDMDLVWQANKIESADFGHVPGDAKSRSAGP